VGVWSSGTDEGYALNRLIGGPSVIGVTEAPLPAARAGLIDRGPALRVRVFGGTVGSAAMARVLNGANLAAIGVGGLWEVFQFGEADLVAPDTYALRSRLRGQAGTDGVMPAIWPAGSTAGLSGRGAGADRACTIGAGVGTALPRGGRRARL
jgi:hypothetical protein